jgi:cyclopropane-fatty-acyl-phospholipid synthase
MDYTETLKHWAANIDDNLDEATRLAGPERIRVWRLYLRAARRGFESGFTSIYQVRGSRPASGG